MKKLLLFIIQLVLILTISCTLTAQKLTYKQYTEEDGLPSLTTYEIVQDSSGILWVGTDNGLVSFDGEKFEKHLFSEFKDNEILQTFIHETGDVGFVNLANEFGLLCNSEIQKYKHTDNFTPNAELTKFDNKNFLRTSFRLKDSVISVLGFLHLNENRATNDSSLVINKKLAGACCRYILEFGKSYHIYKDSLLKKINDSRSMILLYVYVQNNEKNYIQHRSGVSYEVTKEFVDLRDNSKINYFIKDEQNYVYIFNNIIYSYNPNTNKSTLINKDHIYQYLFIDRENILWATTQNDGLIKFDNYQSKIESIAKFDKEIISINKANKSFLVTLFDKGVLFDENLLKIDEVLFRYKQRSATFTYESEHIILNGSDIIIASNQSFNSPRFFLNRAVKDLITIDNKLYVGTHLGLFYNLLKTKKYPFDNDSPQKDSIRLLNKRISKLLGKKDKSLLIGTSKGLYIDKDLDSPVLYIESLKNEEITALCELNDSILLVGTENKGLYIITDGEISDYLTIENGLPSNSINDIAVSGEYVVLGTNKGITLFNNTDKSIQNITSFDGLPSNKVNSVMFHEDHILAGAGKTLIKLNIDDFSENNFSSSRLTIAKVLINNEEIDWSTFNNLDYTQNKIDIYCNHISLRSSQYVKSFKYRIKEIDENWETSKEPVIRLPALEPGTYSVEAKGINEVGDESNHIELSFCISPPWWQTWYARILAILGILLMMYTINKYRIDQFKKKEKVKRDYLIQINNIKEQALQLQMNPHFIFNSLNAIQNFIVSNEEKNAINYLARFARMIRLIFEHSKGNKISLEEEIEFMNLYLDLEKLRFKDKVDIEFTISDEISENKDVIKIPPLLIQPIVENSFKHGLFHKVGKGKLLLDYKIMDNFLVIKIQDNGIGRKASEAKKARERFKHVSSGMSTTKERLELNNFGKAGSPNSMIVEDLYDDNNNSLGTKTVINVSLS